MKEFVEKLIGTFKCEELRTDLIAVGDVISIINQLAEEYNPPKSSGLENGWIPCMMCESCEYKECEHHGKI